MLVEQRMGRGVIDIRDVSAVVDHFVDPLSIGTYVPRETRGYCREKS